MNTFNNKRRQKSKEKIENVFIDMLETKEINEITVSDICKSASLNRSTFYANYTDIYDLAEKIKNNLKLQVKNLYQDEMIHSYNSNNYCKLFQHIKDNQPMYKLYFKLGFDNLKTEYLYDTALASHYFDNKNIEYHIEFFKAGFNSIVKIWLSKGCIETPEEMNEILISEYKNRT